MDFSPVNKIVATPAVCSSSRSNADDAAFNLRTKPALKFSAPVICISQTLGNFLGHFFGTLFWYTFLGHFFILSIDRY